MAPPTGSLHFHSTPCPTTADAIVQFPIELEKPLFPPPNASIQSLRWNYPSNLKIRFYKDQQTDTPYATITGPTQVRFTEDFCSFVPKHYSTVAVEGIDNVETSPLFLGPTSFFIISML
jgi:hypothetical protein